MINQPLGPGQHHEGVASPSVAPAPPTLRAFGLRVAVAVLVTVLILIVVYVLWQGVRILLETFAGILFAVFLTTLTGWVSRYTKLRHGWSLAVVCVALVLLAAGLVWLLATRLTSETVELAQALPQSLGQLRDLLAGTGWGHYLLELSPATADWLARPGTVTQVTGLVFGVVDFLVALLVIFFVGLFGAAEPDVYRAGLLHLIPPSRRQRAGQALDAVVDNLRWWLGGQLCLMVIVGVVTGVGLWLLGIPLALSLGLVAGLFEMVPYLGPWLAVIPAALIALLVGPWHVLTVLGLYLGVHVLEGYVLGPLVQRRAVRLPPALMLVAQVLLGYLLGLLGLFVAAPLTAAAVVGLKMLYVQDTLGDQNVTVSGATRRSETRDDAAAPPEARREDPRRPGDQDAGAPGGEPAASRNPSPRNAD